MPRNVSSRFREAAYAQETGEVPVSLLRIDHVDLANPIRACNDADGVTRTESGSQVTYPYFPFKLELPTNTNEETPHAQLTISNVDQTIITQLRGFTSKPTVEAEVVLAATPGTTEIGPLNMDLRNPNYDVKTITGELRYEPILQRTFPADRITPSNFNQLPGR